MPRFAFLISALFLTAAPAAAPTAALADPACLTFPSPDCLVAMAMQLRPQDAPARDRAAASFDIVAVSALVRTQGPEAARAFGLASPHLSDPLRVELAVAEGLAASGRAEEAVAASVAWKAAGRNAAFVQGVARHLGAGGHTDAVRSLLDLWRPDEQHTELAKAAAQGLIVAGRPGAPELLLEEMARSGGAMIWVGDLVEFLVVAGQAEAALPLVRSLPPGGFKVAGLAQLALALDDPALAAEAEAEVETIADAGLRSAARRYVAASRTIAGGEDDAMRGQVFLSNEERIATVATVVAAMGERAFTTRHMLDTMLRRIGDDKEHGAALQHAAIAVHVALPLHPFRLDLIGRTKPGSAGRSPDLPRQSAGRAAAGDLRGAGARRARPGGARPRVLRAGAFPRHPG